MPRLCERGPLVVIQPADVCYVGAQQKNIPAIVDKLSAGDGAVDKLLYLDEESGKRLTHLDDIPFYKYQKRVLLENNVKIDAPKSSTISRSADIRRWQSAVRHDSRSRPQ